MENKRENSDRRYVAFLRGINVGGHASIKMADLQAAFEKMDFREVRPGFKKMVVRFSVVGEEKWSDNGNGSKWNGTQKL